MSGRGKRKMGGCQLMALVVAEGVAVIAAIVAITGTFWLGAGPLLLFHVSLFRVFLRVSRAMLIDRAGRDIEIAVIALSIHFRDECSSDGGNRGSR